MDLCACIDEPIILAPSRRTMVPTGIAISVPIGYEAQIRPRSGLAAKHGLTLLNAPGTIDADYRGEIKIILINHGETAFRIKRGERIAQMIIQKVYQSTWEVVDELPDSERSEGGFGHTGH